MCRTSHSIMIEGHFHGAVGRPRTRTEVCVDTGAFGIRLEDCHPGLLSSTFPVRVVPRREYSRSDPLSHIFPPSSTRIRYKSPQRKTIIKQSTAIAMRLSPKFPSLAAMRRRRPWRLEFSGPGEIPGASPEHIAGAHRRSTSPEHRRSIAGAHRRQH